MDGWMLRPIVMACAFAFVAVCYPLCSNGGECISPMTCRCKSGFTGDLCNEVIVSKSLIMHGNGFLSRRKTSAALFYLDRQRKGGSLHYNIGYCNTLVWCSVVEADPGHLWTFIHS